MISLPHGHGLGPCMITTHSRTRKVSHVNRWRKQVGRCVEGPLND